MPSRNDVDTLSRCRGKSAYPTWARAEQVIENMLSTGRGAGKGNRLNVIECRHDGRTVYHVGTTMRARRFEKPLKYRSW